MRIVIRDNSAGVADYTAEYIIKRIKTFAPTADKPFVLGLPTGGTPVPTYQRLVKAFREGRISFKHVVTFNMDEYVGLPREHPESYWSFMHEQLFKWVDIPAENINLLDGNAADLEAECARYEDKITKHGGIELFLAGVGSDGHIAFNEPGSSLASRTRVKSLNEETIAANARFFGGDIGKVPTMALTVGVATVMASRTVVVLATGANKAWAVSRCVEGAVSNAVPITMLQVHKSCVLVIDEEATHELRVKTVRYFQGLAKREHELALRQAAKVPAAKL